jgi:hypothetical protein
VTGATTARSCARCNDPLLSQDGRRRFCSGECASAARRERWQATERVCKRCRELLPDDANHRRRYCGDACFEAVHGRRLTPRQASLATA